MSLTMLRAGRRALVGLTLLAVACAAPRPESKPAASGQDEAEVVVQGIDEGGESHEPAPVAAAARPEAEQAYRFALGEEVVSSTGVPARLSRPLDFLVVTDHADTPYSNVALDLRAEPYVLTLPAIEKGR